MVFGFPGNGLWISRDRIVILFSYPFSKFREKIQNLEDLFLGEWVLRGETWELLYETNSKSPENKGLTIQKPSCADSCTFNNTKIFLSGNNVCVFFWKRQWKNMNSGTSAAGSESTWFHHPDFGYPCQTQWKLWMEDFLKVEGMISKSINR